ncbi:hypothetical protein GCM10018965_013250 [Nonomuraea roseola]
MLCGQRLGEVAVDRGEMGRGGLGVDLPAGLGEHDVVAAAVELAKVGGDPEARAAVTLALVTGLRLSVRAGQCTGEEAAALLTAHLDGMW